MKPKQPPRRPQRHPKIAQESPETPSRASLDPKPRLIEHVVFFISKIEVFDGGGVRLRAQSRHEEAPREGKQRRGRREPKKRRKKAINFARRGPEKEVLDLRLRKTNGL